MNISSEERLDIHFITVNGKVESFGVCYELLFEGTWRPLKRCDNSHDTLPPHCHIYGFKRGGTVEDESLRVNLPEGEPGKLLTQVIADLKRNRVTILEGFKSSYERDRKNN